MKTMDWAGELTYLFKGGNTEAIHLAIQGLTIKYNGEFDATILLDKLVNMKTPDSHWAFTSPATMIAATVIIFLIRVCIWKHCCSSWELTALTLSPPTMPMPASGPSDPTTGSSSTGPSNHFSPEGCTYQLGQEKQHLGPDHSFTWLSETTNKNITLKNPKGGERYWRWYFVNLVNFN
jgi:hypothetical protein